MQACFRQDWSTNGSTLCRLVEKLYFRIFVLFFKIIETAESLNLDELMKQSKATNSRNANATVNEDMLPHLEGVKTARVVINGVPAYMTEEEVKDALKQNNISATRLRWMIYRKNRKRDNRKDCLAREASRKQKDMPAADNQELQSKNEGLTTEDINPPSVKN